MIDFILIAYGDLIAYGVIAFGLGVVAGLTWAHLTDGK